MAEKEYIVRHNRDVDGNEFLPRKADGSEYQPGEKVTLQDGEEHFRTARLGIQTGERMEEEAGAAAE